MLMYAHIPNSIDRDILSLSPHICSAERNMNTLNDLEKPPEAGTSGIFDFIRRVILTLLLTRLEMLGDLH